MTLVTGIDVLPDWVRDLLISLGAIDPGLGKALTAIRAMTQAPRDTK